MRETLCLFLAFSALAGAEDFTIKTFAGGGLPQNIQGTSAVFPLVGGIVADANGNAYFVASFHTVMRLDQNGVLTVVAGNGTPGYSGDGGLATNAQLNQPATIALDGTGNLYIADYGNGRIRKVQNGIISTIAGGGTQTADNVPAVNALINALYVAADAAGNVYVEDPSPSLAVCCRIRKVANGVITTIAGNGTFGYSGDGGPATSAQLFRPGAMALDAAGTLYFFDDTTSRTSIMCGCYLRKIQNGVITTVAPTTYLNSIAIDAAGNIFIGGSALQELSNGVFTPISGTQSILGSVTGLSVDKTGNIFIATSGPISGLISKISNGVASTVAGNITGNGVWIGDGGQPDGAQLSFGGGRGGSIAMDKAETSM